MKRLHLGTWILISLLAGTAPFPAPAAPRVDRVKKGLLVLYDFGNAQGDVVKDRSGRGEALDLKIVSPKSVRRKRGSLEVHRKTILRSEKPASKIIDAVRKTGEITIEAWIRPSKPDQKGPARIVTLSKDSGQRNFTLGQEGTRVETRFRTEKTSANGLPGLRTPDGVLHPRVLHVVYTRSSNGRARLYVDSRPSRETKTEGPTTAWAKDFRLALANELSSDRPWLGTFFLVAIYDRDLTHEEVERNYGAGAGREAANVIAADKKAGRTVVATSTSELSARYFDSHIAPLLARRCLECHGWKSRKGKLDLSRKEAAFKGGSEGKAIVPGKSTESLLWESVESDEMPYKRDPLSREEKRLLKTWIDAGAFWGREVIAPPTAAAGKVAGATWLQRLTVSEYIETVRAAVGVDIAEDARRLLPRDLRADGFSNTAYNLNVDLKHVEAYAELAGLVVERMNVPKFVARFAPDRKLDDASLRPLIASMGKWLLRGPLQDHEIAAFLKVPAVVAKEGGNFDEACAYLIRSMLQSPKFIYRIENQQGDGKARPAGAFELASRMSYIVWGGPPDAELMKAAETGGLADRERAAAQVTRMLADPRAVERSAEFITEWLNLGRLSYMRPNAEKFPNWDPKLAADMKAETVAFFKDVAWTRKRPLQDLLNAQVTFLTPRLAKHYGLKPQGDGLRKYDVSSVPARGGLLTQAGVLTVGGDTASMVTRGLFVLHDILRGEVKDPPPGVDTTPVPSKPGLSNRAVSEKRIANPSCGGCHSKFEPFAFGLEKFNGIGVYREVDEHGNKLRDDGEILFPESEKPVPYKTSRELMNLLAGSERVREALTWKVTQFALGRPLVEADAPELDRIHKAATEGGGTYAALITAIVLSDLVQLSRTEVQ